MKFPFLATNQRPTHPLEPALYAYTHMTSVGQSRIHLRIDSSGEGTLLINANRAIHLNPTAAYIAWLKLEGCSEAESVQKIRRQYRVNVETALEDIQSVQEKIEQLIQPDGACPIHDLALDVLPPFSKLPSAPYRMDLALTYRCNAQCHHCYNARPRDYPELTTEQWSSVINQLWQIGIPHICFTGGESTLRQDLPALITLAESNGQITGLLTNGIRLAEPAYVESLVEAGLDHVQITLESHVPEIHDRMVGVPGAWQKTVEGIRNCLSTNLYVMTNTTLLQENAAFIPATIDFLADLGVPTIGCNALIYSGKGKTVGTGILESDLAPILETVRSKTDQHAQRLIWYTPTQYCDFDPVQMQLGVKACTAARYNMCIEPDGSVIPCQSYYSTLGNILHEPWEAIWNHDLSVWLRERQYVPEGCEGCALLRECGGGCPLTLQAKLEAIPKHHDKRLTPITKL